MLQNNLVQLVSEPTRENAILDIVLTNSPQCVSQVNVCPPFHSDCDHASVEFVVIFSCSVNSSTKKEFFYDYNKCDYEGMKRFINNVDWSLAFSPFDDVNSMWSFLWQPYNKPSHSMFLNT